MFSFNYSVKLPIPIFKKKGRYSPLRVVNLQNEKTDVVSQWQFLGCFWLTCWVYLENTPFLYSLFESNYNENQNCKRSNDNQTHVSNFINKKYRHLLRDGLINIGEYIIEKNTIIPIRLILIFIKIDIHRRMSLFRSAAMKYYELYIPSEDAFSVVSKLAPENFVEFLDAAPNNFHKPFSNSIKRCEEIISKIDRILHQVRQYKIELPEVPVVQKILEKQQSIISSRKITSAVLIDEVEEEIQKTSNSIEEQTKSLEHSQKQIIDLEDFKYLLFKAGEIFATRKDAANEMQEIDFSKTTLSQLRLVNISGVIPSKDILKFGKMVFRATKGHSILYTFNVPNDTAQKNFPHLHIESRTAFIIIMQSGANILTKVTRICDSFQTKKFTLTTNKEQIFQKIKAIEDTINDTKKLCAMTQKKLRQDLQQAVSVNHYGYSKYETYRVLVERQLLIYNTLNLLSTDHYNGKAGSTMIAKIWIPQDKKGRLFNLMPSVVTIRQPQTTYKPPTYFQLNEFTAPFQAIVDTYGIPRYQEINPALFAIGIFPFLFGVMFGDIGHGGAVLALAIWLVKDPNSKKLLPEVYSIRYLVLLMGMFAFYSGWIYNEFFSIPLNVFGSCYGHAAHDEQAQKMEGCVYPLGFDPKWIRASNQLNYFNSYKMKFAVLIGVIQMTFAIFLKLLNSIHFKNYVDIFFEWLPQQIFFFCTFGYMCILIVGKWMIPWGIQRSTAQAPSIISQMIALPLKLGSTEGKPLWDMQTQQSLQYNLLIMSLICVPWMLIFKPLVLWMRMPSHHKPYHARAHINEEYSSDEMNEGLINNQDKKNNPKQAQSGSHDEHDMSEIVVHQIIQTIEFVLGTISNTASYLRLWALSLAHGQLARVFLQKTIGGGIQSANTLVIVIGMYFFCCITVGVIMGMDSMQCFLHALRLQWVQFNSKFFKADGRKFIPLQLVNPIQTKILAMRAVE